jgi:hypothetical protein
MKKIILFTVLICCIGKVEAQENEGVTKFYVCYSYSAINKTFRVSTIVKAHCKNCYNETLTDKVKLQWQDHLKFLMGKDNYYKAKSVDTAIPFDNYNDAEIWRKKQLGNPMYNSTPIVIRDFTYTPESED